MKLGYIGLGKMGANMVLRLIDKNHRAVVFDVSQNVVKRLSKKKGITGASSITELISQLRGPRLVWIMVPHRFVDDVLAELIPNLKRGDTVIDGGNSPYKDSKRRSKQLAKKGIKFLDVGVSGGPKGARDGACMMVGGQKSDFNRLEKLFRDLCIKDGYGYMGKAGAGHFVKMVHNGIEYGMMQAIAEGFDVMNKTKEFDLNLKDISRVYEHGSVIESNLMTWMRQGFEKFGIVLKRVSGSAVGTGEGKWTVEAADRLKVPVHVIKQAFLARKRSEKKPSFQGKLIMAMRNQFGGHDPNPKKK